MVSPSARPKRQHGAADHAGASRRAAHPPHHFPAGAAQAVGGFLQHAGHGLEHIARHRRNEGQDHDGKDQAGGENADAIRRRRRTGCRSGSHISPMAIDDRLLHMGLEPGREHEQAPDAVDDGGNAGQQLDGDADGASQRTAGKDRSGRWRCPTPTGSAISMAIRRGDQRAINGRPARRNDRGSGSRSASVMKPKPKALKAGIAADHQRNDHAREDQAAPPAPAASAIRRKRKSPAPARAGGLYAGRKGGASASQADIGQRRPQRIARVAPNSHPA